MEASVSSRDHTNRILYVSRLCATVFTPRLLHIAKIMFVLLAAGISLVKSHNYKFLHLLPRHTQKMPRGMVDGQAYADYIQQPATRAGDVVLFSEGTVHGALPWTPANRQRRACLYRFAPATHAYGRSYFGCNDEDDNDPNHSDNDRRHGWPKAMYEGLNDAQRAVLEPPYANRLDRPNIEADGSVTITTRSERKKQHDRDVFGTKYF